MIYLDPMSLGPISLINSWIKHEIPSFLNKDHISLLTQLLNWIVEPCLEYVEKFCDQFLNCSQMHLTLSFLKLLNCMLDEIK